jgi:hypothetical protein
MLDEDVGGARYREIARLAQRHRRRVSFLPVSGERSRSLRRFMNDTPITSIAVAKIPDAV